jgi:hypothetical protein
MLLKQKQNEILKRGTSFISDNCLPQQQQNDMQMKENDVQMK